MDDSFTFYSDKLSFAEVKGKEGTEYFIKGHISTGDLDLVDDIVTKDCLSDMYSQFDSKNMKLDFEHEAFRGKSKLESEINKTKLPLGKAVTKNIDAKGLEVKWQLNPTWQKFDEKGNVTMTFKSLWTNIKSQYLDAFSIAYIPISTQVKNIGGKKARLLKNIRLLNVALTGNPINTSATMTSVMAKSLDYLNKKGYEKDGAHAHTEENLGIHNHPEIEKQLQEFYSFVDRRIDWVNERITDLQSPKSDTDTMTNNLKSHGGNNMAKEENDADNEDQEPDKDKQTKSVEMVEVKALVKSVTELTKEVKSVTDTVKELKEQVEAQDKILSKAQTKALGAESKAKETATADAQTQTPEVKSVLGMI